MANIGLRSFLFAEMNEKKKTYAAPTKLAGAIEFKESLTTNDAKLYADDVLQESDTSISGGNITLGIDDDDDTIFAPLLGKKINIIKVGEEEVVVVTSNTADLPKAVGFGYITSKVGGKYKVHFYPKIKFSPYSIDAKTQEEKMEYTTPSVEGTLFPLEDGTYRKEATVGSLELAVATLKAFFVQDEETAGDENTSSDTGTTGDDTTGETGDDETGV